jgi:GDP-L-fucose synthase
LNILVFGSNGLVGSSVVRRFQDQDNISLLPATRKMANLFQIEDTNKIISDFNPDIIVNAAARVGGILANNTNRTEFILENLKININIIESIISRPKIKLINLGSSCIYPLNAENPIDEKSLMTGKLEPTNSPYAMAKLSAIELGDALKSQFGHVIVNLMPTNLYGPNDNFDEQSSHVIPGLMGRLHNAKVNNEKIFSVWGTGEPLREFLYVDDLANCIDFIIKNEVNADILNVGSGIEISIKELVAVLAEVIGYGGEITFDSSKPDGNPRKLLDSSKLNGFGWKASTSLKEGLKTTYDWYLNSLS